MKYLWQNLLGVQGIEGRDRDGAGEVRRRNVKGGESWLERGRRQAGNAQVLTLPSILSSNTQKIV